MPTTISGTSGVSQCDTNSVSTAAIQAVAVTSAKLAAAVQPIGVGQTWQDVSASRVLGTTYTNSTGRPITVSFNGGNTALSTAVVAGVTVAKAQAVASSAMPMMFIVPDGASYSITGGTISVWVELR